MTYNIKFKINTDYDCHMVSNRNAYDIQSAYLKSVDKLKVDIAKEIGDSNLKGLTKEQSEILVKAGIVTEDSLVDHCYLYDSIDAFLCLFEDIVQYSDSNFVWWIRDLYEEWLSILDFRTSFNK